MANADWTRAEKALFRRLSNPEKIQSYVDKLKYNITDITRSPRYVIKTGQAHCFDGAMFAAAALSFRGEPPLLADLRANEDDDDHILAIFKRDGLYGAIAQSNYTGCRYRDPIHRNMRELALSYFNTYFNLAGSKTLREYSVLFDLRRVKDINWRITAEDLTPLGNRIDAIRHFKVIPAKAVKNLTDADDRLFAGETIGLDPRGAFKIAGARI